MNRSEIVERVAAGMRAMRKSPDAFLFIEQADWTWDDVSILGVPVFHAEAITCNINGSLTEDCQFVPLGKSDGAINQSDRKRFAEAFEDECKQQGE